MALELAFHGSKPLPQSLRKLRAALAPLGLSLAFELDCEAIFRNKLHVGLGRSHVLGVYDPLCLLEGYSHAPEARGGSDRIRAQRRQVVPVEISWLSAVRT